jgi:hypothetical protein
MPTDLNTIYAIDTAIQSAVQSLISSSVVSFSLPRDETVNVTPDFSAAFFVGSPTGHIQPMASASVMLAKHDTLSGTLEVQVMTDRATDNTSHQTYLNIARSILSEKQNYKQYLQWHDVLDIEFSGQSTSVDNDKNQDITNLSFNLKVCIDPTSWGFTLL